MGTKILKRLIAIICIIAMILPISSEVLAKITETNAGTKQKFGITSIHKSRKLNQTGDIAFGYKVNEREVYRIYSGSNDYETSILCLDPTKKFPREDGSNVGNYISIGEATESNLNKVNSKISSGNGAKKIDWLIKNAILPEDSNELKEQKLSKIFNSLMESTASTQNPLTLKDIKEYLTEDDLVFALQCTIWKITNNISPDVLLGRTNEEQTFDGLEGNDRWGYKGRKGAFIREIMNYYDTQLSGTLSEDTSEKTDPIFDTTIEATTNIEGAYAYIGPFKIKEATNYYSIDIKFEDKTGKELTNVQYTLTDKPTSQNVKILQQTKEGLEGKEFYIRVRNSTAARKVKFNLTTQVTTKTAVGTVWEDENKNGQPLLSIEREEIPGKEIPYEKEFDIVIEKQYDVALRKNIYAIKKPFGDTWKTTILNGTEDRNPGDAVKATGEEIFNQYEYRHRKDPVEVEVGDRIVYKITVYNEGKNEVIIKSIADYLPPSGIEYVSEDKLNSENWSYSSTNRRVVNPINQTLRGVNENGIASAEFYIVCEVTEQAKGKIVTNIAEITEIAAESETGGYVTVSEDIDSKTSNINLPTTEEEWQKYKGNTDGEYENPDDLSRRDCYYKGQEDDDDFEKIEVKGEQKIDLALRKSITHLNGKEVSPKRIGTVNTAPLKDNDETTTTADYSADKKVPPVDVNVGDIVAYKIRVYNEGDTDGYASIIEDYIPEGLGFIPQYIGNIQNGWTVKEAAVGSVMKLNEIENAQITNSDLQGETVETASVIKGKACIQSRKLQDELIPAYNKSEDRLDDTKYLQLYCIVLDQEFAENETERVIRNVAAITEYKDENKQVVPEDIDSHGSTINPDNFNPSNHEDDEDYDDVVLKKEKKVYDLALKKYITSLSTADGTNKVIPEEQKRNIQVTNVEALVNRNGNNKADATYALNKTPVEIADTDYITYTIRVFNEGEQDAVVKEIVDTVPKGLEFVPYEKNADGTYKSGSKTNYMYQWEKFVDTNTVSGWKEGIKTKYLEDTVIPAFDKTKASGTNKELGLSYVEIKVEFKVNLSKLEEAEKEEIYKNGIKNIAEITEDDGDDNDSNPNNKVPEEDDEDYDIVVPTEYDLALKKFITKVTTEDGTNKIIPEEQKRNLEITDVEALVNRKRTEKADATYKLNKTPVNVSDKDYVTYTIRVFNEGNTDAIVKEIMDTVPDGLEFVPYETNEDGTYKSGSKTNYDYKWEQSEKGITTKYLDESKISAFDKAKTNGENKELGLSYLEVKVEFKVNLSKIEESDKEEVLKKGIKNIAEITKDDGDDNDSTPDNQKETEDDEDYDIIIPQQFDLSLRKFITKIDNKEITDRIPEVAYTNGKLKYSHTKQPKIVVKGQVVIYTIRVYNEGTQAGYASEITDDLPKGITFLPEHEINTEYEWKMYDEDGKETDDVSKAVKIKTNYLSKEKNENNLLNPFDNSKNISETNPYYKDVKVAFEVTQDSVTSGEKIIINTAEISEDKDKYGNEVEDIDSIPDNNKEDEDDIDKEYIELKYFDLSLLKYVSKVIVTEDGLTKEIETGYDGTENPEPVVKVELNKKKLDKTEVKYVYSIKITNEGEIEGYSTEITDRIPEGLAFYEEDNTEYNWKIKEDGIVTTDYLKDTLLKPGESATIQIVLRWEKSETNLGQKVNTAEISADDNEYDIPDIDSTPNNNKDGEDDQDSAIVVLTLKTGAAPMYITLITTIMAIFGIGFYLIYKYVVKK